MPIVFRAPSISALALFLAAAPLFSQEVVLFPGRPLFAPLRANHEEPRMGFQHEIDSPTLHVQIGSAIDALGWTWGEDTLRLGADFFAYALAATFGEYRFKIDAADGFFGLRLTYHTGSLWSARLRILHYSAHLVDARFNTDRQAWETDRLPFPFSRNFAELTLALRPASHHRLYAGAGLSVFNRPRSIRAATGHWGAEIAAPGAPTLYCAYHGSLLGVPAYIMSHTIETGIKVGTWQGEGLRIYIAYHGGLDWYGEYYNERRSFFGAGLVLDY